MIRIDNVGTVGLLKGGRVVPVSAADGPVSGDPAAERSLVERGLAVWAEEPFDPATAKKADLYAFAAAEGLYEGSEKNITADQLRELIAEGAQPADDDGGTEGDPEDEEEGGEPEAAPEGEEPPAIEAAPVVED